MSARRSIAAGANFARHWLWQKDIRLERRGARLLVSVTLVVAAMVAEISVHFDALSIPHLLRSDYVTVFYNVPKLNLAGTDGSLALVMIYAAIARTLFGIVIAIADAVFYCKITKRPFDWESMVNVAVVNCIFLLTLFTLANPAFSRFLVAYDEMMARIPTIAAFAGVPGLLVACSLGDLAFYWSHRWCHKIRFFWNLGHINHHRSRNLSQLTYTVDPQAFVLDTAGGKVFLLLLLPFFAKLFAVDLRNCGWILVAAFLVDIWTNPSHSVVLYYLEIRFAFLRAFRWVFVTPAVPLYSSFQGTGAQHLGWMQLRRAAFDLGSLVRHLCGTAKSHTRYGPVQ